MKPFPHLTRRILLIAVHDALVTAIARRAELLSAVRRRRFRRPSAAAARHPAVLRRLQYRRLLRLQPDAHEVAVHVASRAAQHHQGRDHPERHLAGARLHFRRAERARLVLLRQDHHRHLLAVGDRAAERHAACLSLLSHVAHPHPRARGKRDAGPAGRQRRRCGTADPEHRERRGQANLAARAALAGVVGPWTDGPRHSRAWRRRRSDQRGQSACGARQAGRAGGDDAFGAGARERAGADHPRGAQPGPDRQSPAVAGGQIRAAAPDAGGGRGSAAAADGEDRLRSPGSPGEGQVDRGDRRRRFDRRRDLQSYRGVRRRAADDPGKLRAGAVCGDGNLKQPQERRRHRRPDRRYSRSRADHCAACRIQAGHRLSCGCAEACADPRARFRRRRQDQHLRHHQRGRCLARRGREGDGDDLDRQGDRAGVDARA